ncbi:MAG: hypothetical protein IPO30_18230 [Hyphomonadaceae bacterium]|nr:hypothetical protein [Hyphomonadaceae bacterium]
MKYSSILASFLCVLAGAPVALAQTASYTPPKTSWGVPDLQGFFSKASLTTMTRPQGATGLIVSDEEAAKLFNRNIYTRVAKEEAEDQQAVTSGKEKLALLTDANPDRAYNRYWMDPGADLGKINGKYRSSWIVEPADGQIPYLKKPKEGISALASVDEEYADLPSNNPEERGNGERCVYHGSGGPPLQNQMYNNIIQIVQSPSHVMILTEQIHEARIIQIGTTHGVVPKWGGDSIGRYEGNTLVVETTNVEPRQGGMISANGKVTERFTRANDGQILYEFSIEDPTRYSQVWRAEMPLNVSAEPPYEYACHEGNYSMFNTLSGARAFEREGKENGKRKAIFAGVADVNE